MKLSNAMLIERLQAGVASGLDRYEYRHRVYRRSHAAMCVHGHRFCALVDAGPCSEPDGQ